MTPRQGYPTQQWPHQRPGRGSRTNIHDRRQLQYQLSRTHSHWQGMLEIRSNIYLLGKITCTVRRVQDLVVEDGEVQGQSQSNWMSRGKFLDSYVLCKAYHKKKLKLFYERELPVLIISTLLNETTNAFIQKRDIENKWLKLQSMLFPSQSTIRKIGTVDPIELNSITMLRRNLTKQ